MSPKTSSLPKSPGLWLIIKRHGLILDERAVDQDILSVGREHGCDIVLDDRTVSRRAAEFVFEEGGLWVVDCGNLGGISVGGKAVDRRRLWPGEAVEISSFLIELRASAEAGAAWEPTVADRAQVAFEEDRTVVLASLQPKPVLILPDGSHIELEDGRLVLGRSAECDILLDSSAASKRHAELHIQGCTVTLVDLGSTNGCRVNGRRVQKRVLADGDSLALADVTFQVEVPASRGIIGGHEPA